MENSHKSAGDGIASANAMQTGNGAQLGIFGPCQQRVHYALQTLSEIDALAELMAAQSGVDPLVVHALAVRVRQVAVVAMSALGDRVETLRNIHWRLHHEHLEGKLDDFAQEELVYSVAAAGDAK